jgi:hypothetical protein
MLKPDEVFIHPIGCLTNTMGKAELEFAAALIVRWHVVNGHADWVPFTRRQISELLDPEKPDPVAGEWASNPFWCPDPYGLVQNGYVTGWKTPDAPGAVSEKFLSAVTNPGSWGDRE